MKLSAYSRLKRVLKQQALSVPELHRRMRHGGFRINIKSLYHLSDESRPVQRLDMRVAGAICQVCAVPLSEWIVFEPDEGKLRALTSDRQERLDKLMEKNSAGQITEAERDELQTLVREAEEITLANARLLAEQHQRLARSSAAGGDAA
jgi:hypothetical protein